MIVVTYFPIQLVCLIHRTQCAQKWFSNPGSLYILIKKNPCSFLLNVENCSFLWCQINQTVSCAPCIFFSIIVSNAIRRNCSFLSFTSGCIFDEIQNVFSRSSFISGIKIDRKSKRQLKTFAGFFVCVLITF